MRRTRSGWGAWRACCLLVPTLYCIVGVATMFLMLGVLGDYFWSLNWETADGKVTSSRVIANSTSGGEMQYLPEVTYVYEVDEIRYTGNRLFFGNMFSPGPTAQYKVDEYPPGRAIKVFYDPNNPSESVIERRLSTLMIIISLGGIGSLILSLVAALVAAVVRLF